MLGYFDKIFWLDAKLPEAADNLTVFAVSLAGLALTGAAEATTVTLCVTCVTGNLIYRSVHFVSGDADKSNNPPSRLSTFTICLNTHIPYKSFHLLIIKQLWELVPPRDHFTSTDLKGCLFFCWSGYETLHIFGSSHINIDITYWLDSKILMAFASLCHHVVPTWAWHKLA